MGHFQRALNERSDIQQHLGLLHGLALQSERIVEIGFRTGVSTTALCASGREVISYDIAPCEPHVSRLKKAYPNFEFARASSLKVTIPSCDMLFIDGEHTYATVRAELERHADDVEYWIALHDTETFRNQGKDGSKPGLWQAILEFLKANENWKIHLHLSNSHGLTLLRRLS